ncbi:hypothetical protein [Alcanivorax sp. DP30]|uniref:hypothetical protein n=1 Tax=Alcanivorax sp. DP30 TaxID=2606217 RepID=UPI00136CA9E2|nr:hypothetical protein [Alcanivorax sp. DP30]MZR61433.1 hypothetical protein [Alcanivorax sp. DP30]
MHQVDAEITTNLSEPPVLAITEQSAAALSLQSAFPREGASWTCYSAFSTTTALGDDTQGTVTWTITPANLVDPVQIASTLGLDVDETMSALTVQDIFPGSIPAGEPTRLVDESPLTFTFSFMEGPSQRREYASTSFNGKLLVSGLSGRPITTFSFDGNEVTSDTDFPLFVDSEGTPVVEGNELLFPVVSDDDVVIAATTDGLAWTPFATGVAGSEIVSLSLDEGSNRWVLIVLEERMPEAYYLSNSDDESRFTPLGEEPGMASSLEMYFLGTVTAENGEVMLLGVDGSALRLVQVGETDWIDSTLLETSDELEDVAALVKDDVLYVAIGGDMESSGFYKKMLNAESGLQVVSALPENDGIADFETIGNAMLLVTDSDVLLSENNGETWESLLAESFADLIAEGWVLNAAKLDALTTSEVLVSVTAYSQNEEGPPITAMIKVDLASGETKLMGGSGTYPSPTSPNTPDNTWRYLGSVDSDHYRFAFNMDSSMVIERFALKTSVSESSGVNDRSNSSSSGGSSGPVMLLIMLVAFARVRAR